MGADTTRVDIVDAQQEAPARSPCRIMRDKRRPSMPEVQQPGRGGSKAGDDGHAQSLAPMPVAGKQGTDEVATQPLHIQHIAARADLPLDVMIPDGV